MGISRDNCVTGTHLNHSMLNPVIVDELICWICYDIMENPYMIFLEDCKHEFCKRCVRKLLSQKRAKCPLCRKSFKKQHLSPARSTKNIINTLMFKCFHENCQKFLRFEQYRKHLFSCHPQNEKLELTPVDPLYATLTKNKLPQLVNLSGISSGNNTESTSIDYIENYSFSESESDENSEEPENSVILDPRFSDYRTHIPEYI